jgi:putative transferase (TIGR04331 family)
MLKRTLANLYVQIASILTKDQDAFFLNTYLPFSDEMRLHRRLGQVPQLWRTVRPIRGVLDMRQRQWVLSGESISAFEACARFFIPLQLPIIYLESYALLVDQTRKLLWPKEPKLIWTSNALNSDDVFKSWAADKVERGAQLVVGQHGGLYGVARRLFYEDHEVAISDYYLTWGWADSRQSKIKPVGQLKSKSPLGVEHAVQPCALLVTCTMPRQSHHMSSTIISSQWLDYFADQCLFVENLPEQIRDSLIVRLYPQDYDWDQAGRWRDQFPNICLDQGNSNIVNLIRKSRIFISTYNATTFLESFTMNVPTIIYWNPDHWELRDSAVPYFDDLMRVGIFHKSPKSAASHLAAVWDDVDGWWSSHEVGVVLERFKACYCNLPDDLLDRVESTLREIMSNN